MDRPRAGWPIGDTVLSMITRADRERLDLQAT